MKVGRTNLLSNLSDLRLALLVGVVGSGAIIVSLISYYYATANVVVNPVTDERLQAPAIETLAAFLLGLFSIAYGIHVLFDHEWRKSNNVRAESKLAFLVAALRSRPYNVLFVVSAFLYGILFAIISGTLVYQQNLSEQSGVGVPSAYLVTCCDPLGETPRLVVYLATNLGLLIVPLNILLLAVTSWMVGANISLAWYAYKTKVVGGSLKWLGSFGATTGLFTACPTCASLLLLGAVGGGDALAALLSAAQPVLVTGTIVLLGANLSLMTGRLKRIGACSPKLKVEQTAATSEDRT